MLKTVGAGGRLRLGNKYSGQIFELEEHSGGALVLRPVCGAPEAMAVGQAKGGRLPTFRIAEVVQIVMPPRAQRNSRPK